MVAESRGDSEDSLQSGEARHLPAVDVMSLEVSRRAGEDIEWPARRETRW